jgi:hypothetical protein
MKKEIENARARMALEAAQWFNDRYYYANTSLEDKLACRLLRDHLREIAEKLMKPPKPSFGKRLRVLFGLDG